MIQYSQLKPIFVRSDLISTLHKINKTAKVNEKLKSSPKRTDILEQFSEFVQLHSAMKQLRKTLTLSVDFFLLRVGIFRLMTFFAENDLYFLLF